jgi:hypothetical protein
VISSARFAALLTVALGAIVGSGVRAGEPFAISPASLPGWRANQAFYYASLPSGSPVTQGSLPMAPDIDFSSGRGSVPPGTSEQAVFVRSFLTPRLNARLSGFRAVVDMDFASPLANPWTRSLDTEDRVQRNTTRAAKSAVKRYALERLNLTGWSIPLVGGHGRGLAALRTDSGGARLRFGFSHRAPRVEALFPVDHGRVTLSADPLGRVGTAFETPSGRFRFGLAIDPRDDTYTAGFALSL